jgi:hypothetical protein
MPIVKRLFLGVRFAAVACLLGGLISYVTFDLGQPVIKTFADMKFIFLGATTASVVRYLFWPPRSQDEVNP